MRILGKKFRLEFFDDRLERLVLFSGPLLHAHDHVAIHLDESAVAVESETLVFGQTSQPLDGRVVQTEVQNRVHHTGHRVARAGPDRDKQRVVHVAEFLAHGFLHFGHRGVDLRIKLLRIGALVVVVVGADLGADGESAGDGQADAGHFREIGAFAAEQRFHRAVAIRFGVAEIINVFALGARGRLHFFAALFLRVFAHESCVEMD